MTATLALVMALVGWVPPESYHTEHFLFRYPAAARSELLRLTPRAEDIRRQVVGDLGRAPPSPTKVYLTVTRKQFNAAQPGGRALPGWVGGVAYPKRNLIILAPAALGSSKRSREVLLAHEYSHVALMHAVRFRRLPTWFVEGFADLQAAAPLGFDWRHHGVGGAARLRELHRNLGHDHRRANQSYQQSYDLVRYLRNQGDAAQFQELIGRLALGESFDTALSGVYKMSLAELERAWRWDWNWRQVLVPMVTSGLFLWALAAFLLVLGYFRQKRLRREAIAAMEGDELPFPRRPLGTGDQSITEPPSDASAQTTEGSAEEPELQPWQLATPEGEAPRGFDPDALDLEPEPPPLISLSAGGLALGTLLAVALTGLMSVMWPTRRFWLLVPPAVAVALVLASWASRRDPQD